MGIFKQYNISLTKSQSPKSISNLLSELTDHGHIEMNIFLDICTFTMVMFSFICSSIVYLLLVDIWQNTILSERKIFALFCSILDSVGNNSLWPTHSKVHSVCPHIGKNCSSIFSASFSIKVNSYIINICWCLFYRIKLHYSLVNFLNSLCMYVCICIQAHIPSTGRYGHCVWLHNHSKSFMKDQRLMFSSKYSNISKIYIRNIFLQIYPKIRRLAYPSLVS